MKNKTIFYTGNFDINKMNAAGKRVLQNAKVFQRIGYEVILLGMNSSVETPTQKNIDFYVIDGIKVYSYPKELHNQRWNAVRYYNYFVSTIEKIRSDYEITHLVFYSSPSLAIMNTWLICYSHKNNIKVVADVVDWLKPNSNNFLFNFYKEFESFYENAIIATRCDGIIAISNWLKLFYESKRKKVIVVPPIADCTNCKKLDCGSRTNIVYAGVPFRLGTLVNKPYQMKDRLDLILELLSKVKGCGGNFNFDLIGLTKDEVLESLPDCEKYISDLEDSIVFHGKKEMREVQARLAQADYSILIRDHSRATLAGFPTKVSESISCGTPVITNKTSDIESYLVDGHSAVFLTENKNEDIERIKNAVNLTSTIRQQNKLYCMQNNAFSSDRYESIIKKFLKMI